MSDSVTPWTVARQAPLPIEILQARILEWVVMPSSRGSSQPRDQTQVSCIAGKFFTSWAIREVFSPKINTQDFIVFPTFIFQADHKYIISSRNFWKSCLLPNIDSAISIKSQLKNHKEDSQMFRHEKLSLRDLSLLKKAHTATSLS